jgi:hypothetical protein
VWQSCWLNKYFLGLEKFFDWSCWFDWTLAEYVADCRLKLFGLCFGLGSMQRSSQRCCFDGLSSEGCLWVFLPKRRFCWV